MSKIVVITGVCGGIGQALARKFSENGFFIIGLDIDTSKFSDVENAFSANLKCYKLDVTKESECETVFEHLIAEYQKIDIWVNNAGIVKLGPFSELELSEFKNVMDVNFNSILFSTHYWLKKMESWGKGTIVNIASTAGHVPTANISAYVTSKHAIVGLTSAIQMDLYYHQSPVKVVLVSPGFVATDMINVGEKYGFPEKYRYLLGKPENCAKKIVEGVLKGKTFIEPTLFGKIIHRVFNSVPGSGKIMRSRTAKSQP